MARDAMPLTSRPAPSAEPPGGRGAASGGAAGLICALLVSAVARWWGLGAKSLWFDEAYSAFVAGQPLLDIPRLLAAYDTHPPLHYVLLHLWIGVFGNSEEAIRSLSVITSLGVVVLTYLWGRRLGGDRVGVLAAFLVGLSPFQVASAQDARMYPLLTLLAVGASYALSLAVEGNRRQHWVSYAACLALALYTHHFAALVAVAHGAYVLLLDRRREAAAGWLWVMVLVGVAYLPLIPLLREQLLTARAWPDIRPQFGLRAFTDALGLLAFGGGLFGMGTYFKTGALPLEYRVPLLLPFVLIAAAGYAGLIDRRARALLFLSGLGPLAAASIVSLVWNIFYERYFSFLVPPLAIIFAAGVFFIADSMPGRTRKAIAACVVALVASFIVPALRDYYRTPPTYDWRSAARHVTGAARPKDFLLFIPAFARVPFEYYYRGDEERMTLNPVEVLGHRTSRGQARPVLFKTTIDIQRMEEVARSHPRMWIVATAPIGYEARMEVARRLAPYYVEVEGKGFGSVYVFLWKSRVFEGRGER